MSTHVSYSLHVLVPTLPFASPRAPHPSFDLLLEPGKHPVWSPLKATARSHLASILAGFASIAKIVFYAVDPGRLDDVARSRHISRQIAQDQQSSVSTSSNPQQTLRSLVVILGTELFADPIASPPIPGSERLAPWHFDAVKSSVCTAIAATAEDDAKPTYPTFRGLSLSTVKLLLALHTASSAADLAVARSTLTDLFSEREHPRLSSSQVMNTEKCRTSMDELIEVRARELLERMSLGSSSSPSAASSEDGQLHRTPATRRLTGHRRGSSASSAMMRLRMRASTIGHGSKREPKFKKLARQLGLKVVIGLPRADRIRRAQQMQNSQIAAAQALGIAIPGA